MSMRIAEKAMESESAATKTWVISGIQFMTPLKPIYTKKGIRKHHQEEDEEERECCTTPTTPESRIPVLNCPGAPRKRKAVSRGYCNGVREYFKTPELESVLIRCVERS
ncbi:putative cyclin-dependent protein kinase inhibitor SMR [Helianthus annuus]|uniref:Cyclin-dependent protein kinase inhibitor SMR n=1 Tax=Helianthus annuus TaxID=4232 RepID=A0A9K3HJZ3_HELAN|nr:cyclin-dependent protein kinase inhibitor SMR6-like [Helianthus annuus]KAF5779808.1 putative cyclin-dependent protein kinase inhibitor SMR [Helianthus annuus]KAJ0491062.1 putative cyclin-dependent protein kinase inhibitor SMR [Helianthus annuus]KAJ0495444.1 putative cyclin-dependent protein kinase inhibitor SMR [Helianthus annuus]KAJ0676607.1 putative cyclin-dependent protein kinase inhibitor SMR [Helianthus annuus]KAJ0679811.1 putative cyclin-dependent protein kinase inhibitor SMR [Heliant